MAFITLNTSHDPKHIAMIAGDPFGWSVNGDDLTLNNITQGRLDAALAEYNSLGLSLTSVQAISNKEIDRIAEKVRLKYITAGAGQAGVYLEKAEEAADYKVAGYPADLSGYPFIQAEVNATGKTNEAAADDILAQRSAWIATGAAIEEERLGGKKAVNDAATIRTASEARDATIAALKVI